MASVFNNSIHEKNEQVPHIMVSDISKYFTNVYNVTHKKRGIALIFNHEVFDDPTLTKRNGTLNDRDDLVKVLTNLQFDVRVYNDLHFGKLYKVIQEVSSEDHNDNDCILVCVMSHGEDGKIYARDHYYHLDLLWTPFTKSKSLIGKPKIIFIQACRGDKIDKGSSLKKDGNESDLRICDDHNYTIPTMADILVMYSTYQGYTSWRNPEKGSRFIQSLCAEFEKKGNSYDLLTLLTSVNNRVAVERVNPADHPEIQSTKQVCSIVSMLTKTMWFPPKKEIEEEENAENNK